MGTVAVWAVVVALSAAATEPIDLTQTGSRVIVRLQVLDPDSVGGDPMHSLERELHRGVKPDGKTYHVLVAVYDTTTRGRSADVESVTATVIDGHGRTAAHLEPMSAGGEVGYGNYFDFGAEGPYQILVAVRLRGQHDPVAVEFNLAHLPQ